MDKAIGPNEVGRKWIKKSPSPVTLRDKVIKNCLSEIKAKRTSLFDHKRMNGESRNKLVTEFVSDMYHAAKKLQNGNEPMATTVFDDYSENIEQTELLAQIADAIEFELEQQREIEKKILEFVESEEFANVSLYEQDDNAVICPLCRNDVMLVSDVDKIASCSCGVILNLSDISPLSGTSNTIFISNNSNNSNNSNIGASEILKNTLADVYERHQSICHEFSRFTMNDADSRKHDGKNKYDLEFEVKDAVLYARCVHCSFYQRIT